MARYVNTRNALVERCCKLHLRDWRAGTCTGGNTTTVVDATNRNEADDFFNNFPRAEVYIRTTTDGLAPISERRDITDFVSSTGTITVSDAFTAGLSAGDTYSIHTEFARDEVVEAINAAIDDVLDEGLIDGVDDTIQLVAGVYEYDVPVGFLYIYRITMADDNGDFYNSPIPADQYKIVRGLSNPRIHFFTMPPDFQTSDHYYGELWRDSDFIAGRHLRVEGLVRQTRLTDDMDTCFINPTYICAQAAYYLHASRIYRSDTDPDEHRTQAAVQKEIADAARGDIKIHMPANSKAVEL